MKIYTKSGDKGKTSLFDGTRVKKNDIRVQAYGTLDELNSMLGVSSAFLSDPQYHTLVDTLTLIQNDLFDMGAILANPIYDPNGVEKQRKYLISRVESMEKEIDLFTSLVSEQTTFILPGGTIPASFLHVARTICRRAERLIVTLSQKEQVLAELIVYMNRLSDFLFASARFVNAKEKKGDVFWEKKIV